MADHDAVNNPAHYTSHPSGIECIEVTRHMSFNLGNVVKYLWRADHKGATLEDLKKARWYLDDEIKKREAAEAIDPTGWTPWYGGDRPLADGTLVDVRYRDGLEVCGVPIMKDGAEATSRREAAAKRFWVHGIAGQSTHGSDIIAYRVVS